MTVYNINWGQNSELMEACRLLREYAKYVEQVRKYVKELPFPEAAECAVDDCIKEGVLAQLLQSLMKEGRDGDISRALSDVAYREQLYQENNL